MKYPYAVFMGVLITLIALSTGQGALAQQTDDISPLVQEKVASLFEIEPAEVNVDILEQQGAWTFGAYTVPSPVLPESYHFIAEGTQVTLQNEGVIYEEQIAASVFPPEWFTVQADSFVVSPPEISETSATTGTVTVYANMDTFVTPSTTWSGNGSRRFMSLGTYVAGYFSTSRALIRFDNISLPSGAVPTGGTIQLWQYGASYCNPGSSYVARITSGWDEGTVWGGPSYTGNYGGFTLPCYNSSSTPAQQNIGVNASLISSLMSSNRGVLLRNDNEYSNGTVFCSRNTDSFCTASHRPRMVVSYRIDPPGTPSITSPTQNQTITSDSFQFCVSKGTVRAPGVKYDMQLDDSSGFGSPNWSRSRTTTSCHTISGLADKAWHLRARQCDNAGQCSGWTSTRNITVNTQADLAISHEASPDPVIAGTNVTYALGVTNNGPGTATGVTAALVLPENVTFVSAETPGGSCQQGTGTQVDCSLNNLASSGSAAITVVATVNQGSTGTLSSTFSASTAKTDPNPDNNSSGKTIAIEDRVDAAVTQNCEPATVLAGGSVTCTVTVSNNGPLPTAGITLSNTLPANTTFDSAPVGCTHDAGVVTCDLGAMAVDGSVDLPIVMTTAADFGGEITNTAAVSVSEPETDTENNTDQAAITVTPVADLSVALSASATGVMEHDALTYTLNVASTGPGTADNVTVTHTLPVGVTFSGASSNDCVHDGGVVTCTLGTFSSSMSMVINVNGTVNPGVIDAISSTASITSDAHDPQTDDNADTLDIPVTTSQMILQAALLEVGSSDTLSVMLDCQVAACNAFTVDLGFDPAVIQVTAVRTGGYFGLSSGLSYGLDNANGAIIGLSASNLGQTVTPGAALFEFDVVAVGHGDAAITFDNLSLEDAEKAPVTVVGVSNTVYAVTMDDFDLVDDDYITPADVLYVINRIDGEDLSADINKDKQINQADVDFVLAYLGETITTQ